MADLRTGLRTAIGDTRRLVYGLRPPALDELGLLEALRSRIAQYQSGPVILSDDSADPGGASIQIRFDVPEIMPHLPAAVEVAIYRIVEEGLANIIHHAHAKNGLIALSLEQKGVRIEIRDDGAGLPEATIHGIGLNSMRERAVELGGSWTIQSTPGHGTRVCAWLPLFMNSKE
jgi:signal transduction histidine kinase